MAGTKTRVDQSTLRHQIIEEHARNPHPNLDRDAMRAHVMIHEMVERQLADGEPPEVSEALHRLLAGGLSRHEAVHAIGTIVAKEAVRMMKDNRPLNTEAYTRELAKLTVESYRKSLGDS
jgi:hypothetical protein